MMMFCLLAVILMWWKNYKLKKDIYSFEENLEQCLDLLVSGNSIEKFSEIDDSLWNKIYEKLRKLQRIWERQNQKSMKEKKQMKLYKQAEKLDFLLQSMVKMSRLETGIIEIHKENESLYDTLGQAIGAIVPAAEKKGIQLYIECREEIKIFHDRKWTEEAIFNVLDNAVKYTDPGGKIKITAIKQEFFTKISIKDNGKGIAAKRQAQIFGRFYREPEVHNQESIGVGLYLTRKILTLQKGYIEVWSKEGKGADFRLFLPNKE